MTAQELNDAIALQLGRLTIENQALRIQVAALKAQLDELKKEQNE
jgi:hypothetical protein